MTEEEWLNVETEGSDGTGKAVAAVLSSVVEVLREAPEDKRYDFELVIKEQ